MDLELRFCTSADGTRIGYGTLGAGPPLVNVWPWGGMLDADFGQPQVHAYFLGLARGRRVVALDRRGCGASQRQVDDFSLEAHVADVAAVVDHLGLEQFDMLGGAEGAAVTAAYAVKYPQRVWRLILAGPFACGQDLGNVQAVRILTNLIRESWTLGRSAIAQIMFPHGPVEAQDHVAQTLYDSMSPETAIRYVEHHYSLDIRDLLPRIQAPTLVLHRRGDRAVPISAGQSVAKLIANARFVALEGDSIHPAGGSADILRLVDEFLQPPVPNEGRMQAEPSASVLTPREIEVLRLIARGKTSSEISADLSLSIRTVGRHITNIYNKIGARTRADATAYAIRQRLA
jgi:pimeloyl-ACP methyl ester carboxylesterase/DNA-binding CsgD family transcriptional regulator